MKLEELAFENRKTLANLNKIDLLDIIEFLQEDRNQWINQFTKTHNESVEIQKENQELKSQLVGTTHCFDEQEHRKLKKQLEDKEEELELARCDLHDRTSERDGSERKLDECLSQQKEFIKFLEGELLHARYYARDIAHYIEFVLRRYKEITQTKNDKFG